MAGARELVSAAGHVLHLLLIVVPCVPINFVGRCSFRSGLLVDGQACVEPANRLRLYKNVIIGARSVISSCRRADKGFEVESAFHALVQRVTPKS